MANYKPSGGGLAITFDNAQLSLTASQTDATTPATGESDSGNVMWTTSISGVDTLETSPDSGSTFSALYPYNTQTGGMGGTEDASLLLGIGNSTGRYRVVMDANAGTRIISQTITTLK